MNRMGILKTTILALTLTFLGCSHSSKSNTSYSGYGKDSVSAETLKKYAPPELDKEASRKIQNYMDLIVPGAGKLHPDGKSLFFTWRITGIPQVWKLNGPQTFPVQVTGGEARNSLGDITPDGKFLIIIKDYDGEEMPGIYLQSVQGGELKLVQHLPKVVTNYLFTTDDSRYIYYRANDRATERFDIYRYDMRTSKKELIFSQEGTWSVSDYKNDGTLLLKKFLGNIETEFYEWNPKAKVTKPVIGQGEYEEYGVLFGSGKDEYYVRTPKGGEFSTIYFLKNGKLQPITKKDAFNISGFTMDRKKTKIIYQSFDQGYFRVTALDAKSYKAISLPRIPQYEHVSLSGLTDDGKNLTLSLERFDEPVVSFVYNFQTGKLTQWTKPSTPELNTKSFVKADLEYYPAKDGTKIPIYVYKPKKCIAKNLKSPCPVIVNFHGGPESMSVSGWDPTAQLYVESGFIYAYPNVRGSEGYGKSWLAADNGPKRLDVITDIQDAAFYFQKSYAIEGKAPKVGIMGGSYGGYATLIGMSMFGGTYDAGVSIVGMSNLVSFLKNTAPHRRKLREAEYGFLDKDQEALTKLSPDHYLNKIQDPLLIIQGANDPRVPAGEAVQLKESLKQANLILFADEGHGSGKRSNRVLQIGHTLNFFKEHLQ